MIEERDAQDSWSLAIDTSSSVTRLALMNSFSGQWRKHETSSSSHEQSIVGDIESFVGNSYLSLVDIQEVVVGTGPGSFTGLRIGSSVAQGIATALDVPLHGISTHFACAYSPEVRSLLSLQGITLVVVLSDARRDHLFASAFLFDGLELLRVVETEFLVSKNDYGDWISKKATEQQSSFLIATCGNLQVGAGVEGSYGVGLLLGKSVAKSQPLVYGGGLRYGSKLQAKSLQERRGW